MRWPLLYWRMTDGSNGKVREFQLFWKMVSRSPCNNPFLTHPEHSCLTSFIWKFYYIIKYLWSLLVNFILLSIRALTSAVYLIHPIHCKHTLHSYRKTACKQYSHLLYDISFTYFSDLNIYRIFEINNVCLAHAILRTI